MRRADFIEQYNKEVSTNEGWRMQALRFLKYKVGIDRTLHEFADLLRLVEPVKDRAVSLYAHLKPQIKAAVPGQTIRISTVHVYKCACSPFTMNEQLPCILGVHEECSRRKSQEVTTTVKTVFLE